MIHAAVFALAVLLNSLWQAPLVALVTALLLRAAPQSTATTRYAVWMIAFIASCLLPLVTSALLVRQPVQPANAWHAAPAVTVQAHPAKAVRAPAHVAQTVFAPQTVSTAPSVRTFHPQLSIDGRIALAVAAVWLAIALFFLLRLLREIFVLEALKRDALPLPFEYRAMLQRWTAAANAHEGVRLCVSSDTQVPVAVGLFDAMILLPDHLLATLSPEEIDQIALHELAHLRRADDWSNAVQRFGSTIFFFNPAIRWIAAQLDLEREVACDDHVVALSSDVRTYAHCLTKMAEVTAWPHAPLAAPGVFVTRKSISIRIERLLKFGPNRRVSVSYGAALVATALVGAVFAGAATFGPVIASPIAATPAGPTRVQQHHIALKREPVRKPGAPVQAAAPLTPATPATATQTAAASAVPAVRTRIVYVQKPEPLRARHVAALTSVRTATQTATKTVASATTVLSPTQIRCDGCSFSNVDWRGRDLRGIVLRGANLANADLRNADLRNADLTGANLAGVRLQGARLQGTRFDGANFSDVSLQGVDLSGASISGASISAQGADPGTVRVLLTRCKGCSFSNLNLRNYDLRGIRVDGLNLDRADMRGADLRGAVFNGANFHGVQLQGARLTGASFVGCNFDGVDFRGVDLDGARLTGSNLSGAIMP